MLQTGDIGHVVVWSTWVVSERLGHKLMTIVHLVRLCKTLKAFVYEGLRT